MTDGSALLLRTESGEAAQFWMRVLQVPPSVDVHSNMWHMHIPMRARAAQAVIPRFGVAAMRIQQAFRSKRRRQAVRGMRSIVMMARVTEHLSVTPAAVSKATIDIQRVWKARARGGGGLRMWHSRMLVRRAGRCGVCVRECARWHSRANACAGRGRAGERCAGEVQARAARAGCERACDRHGRREGTARRERGRAAYGGPPDGHAGGARPRHAARPAAAHEHAARIRGGGEQGRRRRRRGRGDVEAPRREVRRRVQPVRARGDDRVAARAAARKGDRAVGALDGVGRLARAHGGRSGGRGDGGGGSALRHARGGRGEPRGAGGGEGRRGAHRAARGGARGGGEARRAPEARKLGNGARAHARWPARTLELMPPPCCVASSAWRRATRSTTTASRATC